MQPNQSPAVYTKFSIGHTPISASLRAAREPIEMLTTVPISVRNTQPNFLASLLVKQLPLTTRQAEFHQDLLEICTFNIRLYAAISCFLSPLEPMVSQYKYQGDVHFETLSLNVGIDFADPDVMHYLENKQPHALQTYSTTLVKPNEWVIKTSVMTSLVLIESSIVHTRNDHTRLINQAVTTSVVQRKTGKDDVLFPYTSLVHVDQDKTVESE